MKNIITKIYFVLSIVILASCSSNNEFSRRKYLDGFSGNDAEIVQSIKKENKVKKEIKQSEKTVSQPVIDEDFSAAVDEVKPVVVSENLFKSPLLVNSNKAIKQEAKSTFKEKMAAYNTIRKLNYLNNNITKSKEGILNSDNNFFKLPSDKSSKLDSGKLSVLLILLGIVLICYLLNVNIIGLLLTVLLCVLIYLLFVNLF